MAELTLIGTPDVVGAVCCMFDYHFGIQPHFQTIYVDEGAMTRTVAGRY